MLGAMADLPGTLGDLKRSIERDPLLRPRTVKQELRDGLVARLSAGASLEELFPGIHGYGETVLPQVANAILAGHDILLLGLRGQAKTRLARCIPNLLAPRSPALAGDPLRSHPLHPIGDVAEHIVASQGDAAPIVWLTPEDRYGEKLATPDVSVADLIGDVDPIRAQRDGVDLGDLRAVTFGIVPRANRGVFCINELPDLAPRIQVALFNILEENDVQVRGIPLRLPLDLLLVFTANPEDYTSRGQIVTPLKDRIGAQILTHYPRSRAEGVVIQRQEARLSGGAGVVPVVHPLFYDLIEEVARSARGSEFVDQSSGVSARLTIAALEALHANVLRRGLATRERTPHARLVDLPAVLMAMTGKVELAYEGEQEGPAKVGWHLLAEAVKAVWAERLPPPIREDQDEREVGPWKEVLAWFAAGHTVELTDRVSDADHAAALAKIGGLAKAVEAALKPPADERVLWQEFAVEGLFHGGALAREDSARGLVYSDLLANLMTGKRSGKKPRNERENRF
jgi:magnesium chelatase subunit I